MSENIEYIVDDEGNKVKAIISLEMLSSLKKSKKLKAKHLTKGKSSEICRIDKTDF